jgi:hypothetical protein
MRLIAARFCSIFFTALILAPALAHLLELPNKIHLPRSEYLTVQHIYNGWALFGVPILAALLSMLALGVQVRKQMKPFTLTVAAISCIAAAQAVFWIYTFPANRQTDNWTVLPDNWEAVRAHWEYSHAVGALLTLAAFVAITFAVLTANCPEESDSLLKSKSPIR